jgi:hypothetical protein
MRCAHDERFAHIGAISCLSIVLIGKTPAGFGLFWSICRVVMKPNSPCLGRRRLAHGMRLYGQYVPRSVEDGMSRAQRLDRCRRFDNIWHLSNGDGASRSDRTTARRPPRGPRAQTDVRTTSEAQAYSPSAHEGAKSTGKSAQRWARPQTPSATRERRAIC